jgi:hypothetical protein
VAWLGACRSSADAASIKPNTPRARSRLRADLVGGAIDPERFALL